eukprot:4398976-Pyramimonas_sp.AAC.1
MQPDTPDKILTKHRRRLRGIARRAKLWGPFDRKPTIHGIKVNGSRITDPEGKLLALGQGRGQVFASKQIDAEAAGVYLDRFAPQASPR